MDKIRLQVRKKKNHFLSLKSFVILDTYFYVGVGHFPEQIEKQERAVVVGQKRLKLSNFVKGGTE